MKHVFHNVMGWLKNRLSRMPERDNRKGVWLILMFWVASTISGIIYCIGNPTGASTASFVKDMAKVVGLNSLLFIVATLVLGALFSFLFIPLPRLVLGSFIYTIGISVAVLLYDESGEWFSFLVGGGYGVAVLIIGLFIIILMQRKIGRMTLLALLAAFVVANSTYLLIDKFGNSASEMQVVTGYSEPITDQNPAKTGDYDYRFFTYGSGDDIQREAFGKKVDEVTPSVDASDRITSWDEKRTEFWGYDSSSLPVNGRAWVPEGEGPFPIILMVHGNHLMEEFSTDGYDYLGELFASKGFIAISVDEDFINYSNVSGSPNDNYELRAWMILQHIVELQHMNLSSESVFYQKIDFDQVAFMGHSRGGQAALMAADYTTFFDDDNLLESMNRIHIKGVVSIAPTDKTIDGNKPHMHNISYLFLGGAKDADVSDFRGDRQFYRTTFDPDDDGFKTTLYIAGANHTQFNTSWGKMDLSMPRGLFLNHGQTLAPDDQRQIAKVYMSSFLESIFNNKTSYNKLFKDYRYGEEWLPNTKLVNKYRDAPYKPIVQYEQNESDTPDVLGFKKWEVKTPEDRRGNNHLSDSLLIEWDSEAIYTVDVSKDNLMTRLNQSPENIVLTMANIDQEAGDKHVPDIGIELETTEGTNVQLPLEEFFPFPSVITTNYTHFGLFDGVFRNGKYEPSWEPIFQTFVIPFEAFEKSDPAFDSNNINKVTLHFKSHPGEILIEEIGVR